MSLILDALRKAEQDNLAETSNIPKHSIQETQSRTIFPLRGLIVVLILVNLVTLLVFIGYIRTDTTELKVLSKDKNFNLDSSNIDPVQSVNSREEKKEPGGKQFLESRTQLTFEDIIKDSEKKIASTVENKKSLHPEKNSRKSMLEQHRKKGKNSPEHVTIDYGDNRELPFQAKSESKRKSQPSAEYIPELKELPLDFRRSVPGINVNVFVYSENESERFVVIDMVKYSSGSLLPENMLLKEIRSDSLVLEYRDKIFRIKRP